MPYIDRESRFKVELEGPDNAGELNFAITKVILKYIRRKGLKYQHINDVLGALDGAKLEFVRRHVNSYEDKKIKENGDILYDQI